MSINYRFILFNGLERKVLTEKENILYDFFSKEMLPYFDLKSREIGENGKVKSLFSFNVSLEKMLALYKKNTKGDTFDYTTVAKFASFDMVQRVCSVINSEGYNFKAMKKDSKGNEIEVSCYFIPNLVNSKLHLTFVDNSRVIFDSDTAKLLNEKFENDKKEKESKAKALENLTEEKIKNVKELTGKEASEDLKKELKKEARKEIQQINKMEKLKENLKNLSFAELNDIMEFINSIMENAENAENIA